MDNITVIIHSYSFTNIVECVESARLLTNNILLIGEEIRKSVKKKFIQLGVKIIPFPNQGIVEPSRALGIRKATTSWVFLLDADERITPELAREILVILGRSPAKGGINSATTPESDSGFIPRIHPEGQARMTYPTHYQVPRKEILFRSHWLKYGGWWPNYQTRLIRRDKFIDWPRHIHSTPIIRGKKGLLVKPLLHYSQNDLSDIVNRTIIFETKESELLYKAKKKVSVPIFFRKFWGELFRRLIWWQGFRDGTIGIIESIYQAFSKTITYLFLYEKNRSIRSLP